MAHHPHRSPAEPGGRPAHAPQPCDPIISRRIDSLLLIEEASQPHSVQAKVARLQRRYIEFHYVPAWRANGGAA